MEISIRQLGADDLPRISVIAVMPDCFQTIRKTVRALCHQTIRNALELIIVAPATADLRLNEQEFVGLHSHILVRIPTLEIMGVAREAGVRASRAPFVGFVEDHAYPESDWAEVLLASHAQGNLAAGALMINANPQGMTSWSDLFPACSPRCSWGSPPTQPARPRATSSAPDKAPAVSQISNTTATTTSRLEIGCRWSFDTLSEIVPATLTHGSGAQSHRK